jgi:hypothetical protein
MKIHSIAMYALMFAMPSHVFAQTAASAAKPHAAVVSQSAATPKGKIESKATVTDPDFHVHANLIGLERRVEMLEWRRTDDPAPPHYEQVWVAGIVDSSGYDAKHRNPRDLPFNGARWWSSDARLDGHPVSASVLGALDAWTPFKPDLSQLPMNLSVSFQPDGEWLSTSQDPGHPQVGDVRVRWSAIERTTAPTGIVLVDGHWELPATTAATAAGAPGSKTAAEQAPASASWWSKLFGDRLPWLIGAGVLLGLALLVWKRRR